MPLQKLTNGQQEIIRYRANKLQAKADKITAFRKKYAPFLGVAIAITEPNWATTACSANMWRGDYSDGKYAKQGQKEMSKITGKLEPLSNGHIEDPKADKIHFWSQLGGIFVRAARNRDLKTATATAAVGITTIWRDKRMAETRQFVLDNQLHEETVGSEKLTVSVAAINANRFKTAGQAISETVLISPISENETAKNLALGGLVISTALGIYGYYQYKHRVENIYSQRQAFLSIEHSATEAECLLAQEPNIAQAS